MLVHFGPSKPPIVPFLSTFSVGMAAFEDSHKVVAQKNAFLVHVNAQNEGVSKVRTETFGHGGLKRSFSFMERDLDFQKNLNQFPFLKKKQQRKRRAIVTMKEEDEEGEYIGKNWANGEV
jgi:hypothetical protein